MLLFYIFLLVASSFCNPTASDNDIEHVFYFAPTNKMSHIDNWVQNDKLCIDDRIIFPESENTAAYVDLNLLVNGMILPRDGVLYFDDDITLGIPDHRQCSKRKSSEDVFFNVEIPFGAWFDTQNWEYGHEPALHMKQIPSAMDEVIFLKHSLQMYLATTPKVARMTFDGRQWTTEEFESLLYTVEGQFKVSLGHEIGKKANFHDIEFNIPVNHKPIYIEKPELNHWDQAFGVVNSNSDPNKMEKICSYIKPCKPTEGICIEPIKPFGHCCEICGAVVNFTMAEGDRKRIEDHLNKLFTEREFNKYMIISVERMDVDAAPIEIQISLISTKDFIKTEEAGNDKNKIDKFHEDKFYEAVYAIENLLDSHFAGIYNTAITHTSAMSKIDRSITTFSMVVGTLVGLTVICGVIYFILDRDTPLLHHIRSGQLLNRIRNRTKDSETRVIWRRGEEGTEDIILVDNPMFRAHQEQESEEEEETSFSSPVYSDQPCCSYSMQEKELASEEEEERPETALVPPRIKEDSSSKGNIEMNLIEL